jgi:MFS family permease
VSRPKSYLQYGWTLFVNPIDLKHHWGRAAIQVAFTIFVLTETWLVPVEGWLVDRFGPKIVVLVGGILVAIALGAQLGRRCVDNTLCRGGNRRDWRRRCLRHLCR